MRPLVLEEHLQRFGGLSLVCIPKSVPKGITKGLDATGDGVLDDRHTILGVDHLVHAQPDQSSVAHVIGSVGPYQLQLQGDPLGSPLEPSSNERADDLVRRF